MMTLTLEQVLLRKQIEEMKMLTCESLNLECSHSGPSPDFESRCAGHMWMFCQVWFTTSKLKKLTCQKVAYYFKQKVTWIWDNQMTVYSSRWLLFLQTVTSNLCCIVNNLKITCLNIVTWFQQTKQTDKQITTYFDKLRMINSYHT